MGKRITQIATRTGDDGTTGLGDNTRVSKNSLRVHAMGDVDELNSHIGLLLCEAMPEGVRTLLIEIQHQLFNLGGELSIPATSCSRWMRCGCWTRHWNTTTPPCRACRNSFCRQAPALLRKHTSAAPWPAGPSVRWWHWARKTP